MINRIVYLSFKEEKEDEFLVLFDSYKEQIVCFPGCFSVILLKDFNKPATYFTYSLWDNLDSLELYRNSELFRSVWNTTKSYLEDKPKAWSTKVVEKLDNKVNS